MEDSTDPAAITDDKELWKQLKLSLERPYKDEQGNPLPTLYDLTSDEPPQNIYEE